MTDSRAEQPASETVGQLIERVGEREALCAIVAHSITVRAALAHLLDAIEEKKLSVPVEVYEEAMAALSRKLA